MSKKKLKKRIASMEARINSLENVKHEVRQIGFQQLYNMHDDNDYDWDEEDKKK